MCIRDRNTLKDLETKIQIASSEFLNDYPIAFIYECTLLENSVMVLGSEKKRNILLIIKECLHNVIKHAQASEVSLKINMQDSNLNIEIKDNGKGFDVENISSKSNSFGLSNIQHRAQFIGGDLVIYSRLKQGTQINFSIPL